MARGLRADIDPGKKFEYLDDPELLKELVIIRPDGLHTVLWYLPTLHCAACVWLLEKLPHTVAGIVEARVSLADGTLDMTIDPKVISVVDAARLLNSLGYPAVARREEVMQREDTRETRALLRRVGIAAVSAANTMMLGDLLFSASSDSMALEHRALFMWLSLIIALPTLTYAAFPFFRSAVGSLLVGVVHLDVPISLGILLLSFSDISAVLQGSGAVYFDSVTCLIFLLLLARYLQRRALFRARASSATTWDLLPSTVHVIDGSSVVEKKLRELAVGDCVRVLPNEIIPCDGVVAHGNSSVAVTFLTGEALPRSVAAGSSVFAGSTNIEAALDLVAREVAASSRLGKILSRIKQDTRSGAAQPRWIDTLSGYFTFVVLALSALGAGVWWYIDAARVFDVVAAFLVVTCPCALGLAVPVTHVVALSQAVKKGIFITSAAAIDILSRAHNIFFDKTGTLTEGRMSVADTWGDSALNPLAAALAAVAPNHPVSRAVADYCGAPGCELRHPRYVPGVGVFASWGDAEVSLGSKNSCATRGVTLGPELEQLVQVWEGEGASVAFLAHQEKVVALFKLRDSVSRNAREVVAVLHAQGASVHIISGDSIGTTRQVALSLGIPKENAHAELSPEQKAEILSHCGGISAMVGDGINDALAMKAADVGIGVRGGIEATLESAQIFISEQNVNGFLRLYQGALRVRAVVTRNLVISFAYNVVCGAAALCGKISPVEAALLMPLSSLSVVISAVATRYFRD